MNPARRRSADQERHVDLAPRHFLCNRNHFVEGRCDQPRKPNHVRVLVDGGLQDLVYRDHDAQVNDFVVVAAEDDADNVLANVVDVAFYRRHHDLALATATGLFGFHEGFKMRNGTLHRACTLDDLGEEHFAFAKEFAHDAHAVHQRTFDDVEGAVEFEASLFRVVFNEVDDAVHQRVGQAFRNRAFAPRQIDDTFLAAPLYGICVLDEGFCRTLVAIKEHVLDLGQHFFGNVGVDLELARVHDAHVHAGTNGVVEECRVHGFADRVIASE